MNNNMNPNIDINNLSNISIKMLSSKTLESGEQYGQFKIANLNTGQGITIGNQLRRVLLTDLGSNAISAVRISGINHEFAVVPGMREDVLEILLNIKGIIIKANSSNIEFGRLKVQGPKVISADSIKLPANFEIVNPTHYIGTITGSDTIEMEFKIEYGTGYRLASSDLKEENNKNFLQVDTIFMCVHKVNFSIQTLYDNVNNQNTEDLLLDIWTNGSLSPKDAVFKALKFTIVLYNHLVSLENDVFNNIEIQDTPKTKKVSSNIEQYHNMPVEELHLSVRSYNCFKKVQISTVGELLAYPPERLLELKNFGTKSADDVYTRLKEKLGIEVLGLKN